MEVESVLEDFMPLDLSSSGSQSTSRTNSHESSTTRSSENVICKNILNNDDLIDSTANKKEVHITEKFLPTNELPSCSQGVAKNNPRAPSPQKVISNDLESVAQMQPTKNSLNKFSSSQIKQALAANIVTQRNQNLLSPLNPQVVAQMMANHTVALADIYMRHQPQQKASQEIFRPYVSDTSRVSPTSSASKVNFRELRNESKVDENKE